MYQEAERTVVLKIRYVVPGLDHPAPTSIGNWIDLRAAEDYCLSKGEYGRVSLGVCIEMPPDYEALIAPRSSSLETFGFIQTDSVAVIDNSYKGNDDVWKLSILALKDVTIKKNDRICQFRIQKRMPTVVLMEVDSLDGPNRGGFGSTGRN